VLDVVEQHLRRDVGDVLHLLDHLVDRDRADRHGARGDDRFANLVDAAAGREVHHRVGAEVHGEVEFLQLSVYIRCHGRVADVGVDLDPRHRADPHGVQAAGEMVHVGRYDQPAARDLTADQFGVERLALRDSAHRRRDVSAASVVHLRDTFTHGWLSDGQRKTPSVRGGGREESVFDLKVTPYAGLNRVRFKGSDLSPPWRAPPSTIPN